MNRGLQSFQRDWGREAADEKRLLIGNLDFTPHYVLKRASKGDGTVEEELVAQPGDLSSIPGTHMRKRTD